MNNDVIESCSSQFFEKLIVELIAKIEYVRCTQRSWSGGSLLSSLNGH